MDILSIIPADTILAIGPLALAGIGAGVSALGGLLAGSQNRRTRVGVPSQLSGLVDDLDDPGLFLPALQRSINNGQGAFNIRSNLAAQGIDSPMIANEQIQALDRQRQDAVVSGLNQMEGLRLNALQNALGEINRVNLANAQFGQQHTNNRLGIINSAIGGAGSSIIQGLGQQSMQRFLQNMHPTGQLGGQGFSMMDQFDIGPMNFGDNFLSGFGGSNSFT